MSERTLVIIKPDGVKKNLIGEVIRRFEKAGLIVSALKMVHLTTNNAQNFYIVHKDKAFYKSLADFMSSAPCVPMVIEGVDAIRKVREIMGATDPKKAEKGTIRREFASDIEKNIVHGSDSRESADREIPFFFSEMEIFKR